MRLNLKRLVKGSYTVRFLTWLAVTNFADLAAMALPVRKEPKNRPRIVFGRLDGIGDYVIWSQLFPVIAKLFPSDRFERILIGNKLWEPLAADDQHFDRKIFVDARRFVVDPAYHFKVQRAVRRLNADIYVNPKVTREFLWGDSLARCSGAPERVGSRGLENLMSPLQQRLSDRWYTRLAPPPRPHEHELDSSLRFLEFLNGTADRLTAPPLSAEEKEHRPNDGPFALIFVGSQAADKRWPPGEFAAVARHIADRYGLNIVVSGGPGEEALSHSFAKEFEGQYADLIGKTSLPELERLGRTADLVVTNDTGIGHISAFAGRPTVVVTPGNHIGRFFPYPAEYLQGGMRQLSVVHEMPCFGCGWHCIYTDLAPDQPKPCISGVMAADVIEAVDMLMNGGKAA